MDNKLLDTLEELYNYSKAVINTKSISSITLITLTNKLIQIVEKYKELTGNQKKMLVLDTLTKIINENIDDDLAKQELLLLITTLLPKIIDTVVSAINGNMKFCKDIKPSCFSSLFQCFSKKQANTTTTTTIQSKQTTPKEPQSDTLV
jgi:hypothetical protein